MDLIVSLFCLLFVFCVFVLLQRVELCAYHLKTNIVLSVQGGLLRPAPSFRKQGNQHG